MKNNKLSVFTKGILVENPVLVLILGICPTLAQTGSVISAVGMGLAATAVLLCSNIVISAMRRIIPDSVRIPCYIVIIAGFVSLVQMLLHAYLPSLYKMLGVYLALIVVNCIILGRAEMYAGKNKVFDSALDGLGMGVGFLLALFVMATIREVFGAGTFAGISVPFFKTYNIPVLTQPPGGFFVFGLMIAAVNKVLLKKGKPVKEKFSCSGCPNSSICGANSETQEKDKEGVCR